MNTKDKIYLDNNAATLIDPRVKAAAISCMEEELGNPSSLHAFGRKARAQISQARRSIAKFLNVLDEEIIFTSSDTEGANLIIRGLAAKKKDCHIITSSVEYYATYNTIKDLEKSGVKATYLNPDSFGAVKPEAVEKAILPNTCLIALMAANNETGVKTDIEAISRIAEERNIPFFTDAVAWFGKEQFIIPKGITAANVSGLKIHVPLGIGFCFIRKNLKLSPLITGGEQEAGKRAGTENYIGIAALAKAVEIIKETLPHATKKMEDFRNLFENLLKSKLPNILINGDGPRISNTSNIYFPDIDGETLLMKLDMAGVMASLGSACSSGTIEPSRVLLNMGYDIARVNSSLRFSLSRFTTKAEIEKAANIIIHAISS